MREGKGPGSTRVKFVSNPDADHIGGFLDIFDAFESTRRLSFYKIWR
jgi:hypothetical protein